MQNLLNPSTTKKSKKDNKRFSKEIPIPKLQTSVQLELNTNKIKKSSQSPKAIKKNKENNQNIILYNENKQSVNKTEAKDKKKRGCNSQLFSNNLLEEDVNKTEKNLKYTSNKNIINNEFNKETMKNANNNEKNKKKLNLDGCPQKDAKIAVKNNKISEKDILSKNESYNDLESFGEDNSPSRGKISKNINVKINIKINDLNRKKTEGDNNNNNGKNNSTGNIQIIPIKPQNCKRTPIEDKKQEVKMQKQKQSNKNIPANRNLKMLDILEVDNEFDNSNMIQSNNIQKTKFPKLSSNPFTTKITKKPLILSKDPKINTLSDLKKNLATDTNTNKIPDLKKSANPNIEIMSNLDKKLELSHHVKASTSIALSSSKSPSSKQPSSISNNTNDMPVIYSSSKNTNTKETNDLERIYRKFLLQAKIGDKGTFLDIYRQIYTLEKEYININYTDENGNTALHYACDEGNLKIVEILLKANCDTNIKNNYKQTPLHISTKRGYFDISKMLIESGAMLNSYDLEKNTPLHYVCKNNYIELLRFILTKSPQIDEKNIYGKTPKDLATDQEIKNLLDEYKLNNENKSKSTNNNSVPDAILKTKTKDNIDNSNNLKNDLIVKSKATKKIPRKLNGLITSLERIETDNKKNSDIKIEINPNPNNSFNNISNHKQSQSSIYRDNKINMNCILKKEQKAKKEKSEDISIANINNNNNNNIKDKTNDSNIYFQNTNNINNNNININIYSIEGVKRTRANSNYMTSHNINKTTYKNRDFMSIDESKLNNTNYKDNNINNTNIQKSTTAFIKKKLDNNFTRERKTIHVCGSKYMQSKFIKNKVDNIIDSINSYDKNILKLTKTEENIKNTKNNTKKSEKNKNVEVNLNNSANINIKNISSYLKQKGTLNNSNLIQSTEKILTKSKQTQPKKKESKFKPTKKIIDDSLINNTNISKIEAINRSTNLISSNYKNNLLSNTSLPEQERITPSNFVCLAQLGKGSFGEVYLVQKINSSELYAMKVLRKERIMAQNLLKYAIAERNVLSGSNHPFLVNLKYAFQTSTKLFLVIEYCPNGDLAKHLLFEKRFKEPRAKFYICEVLLALENLHKRDIIFRDLKPDNVVLDKEGHCKLTDFGLSKEGVTENAYAQSFCGSIAYLAPEMLKKQGHGKAVDWYLLGVLFYEMLTGITPYFTTRKEEIFYNIEHGELKIPNFVSKEAAELLKRLLERNPSKRLGGGGRDAQEIKEHPYFKDVDWKKIYEKKIKPPTFVNYMDKAIKKYPKPKLFANDDLLNRTDDILAKNMLPGWSFVNSDDN